MKNWIEVQLEMDYVSRKDIYGLDENGKLTIDLNKFELFNSSNNKRQLDKMKIRNLSVIAEEMIIFEISCGAKALFNAFVDKFKNKDIKATLFIPETTGHITLESEKCKTLSYIPQIG